MQSCKRVQMRRGGPGAARRRSAARPKKKGKRKSALTTHDHIQVVQVLPLRIPPFKSPLLLVLLSLVLPDAVRVVPVHGRLLHGDQQVRVRAEGVAELGAVRERHGPSQNRPAVVAALHVVHPQRLEREEGPLLVEGRQRGEGRRGGGGREGERERARAREGDSTLWPSGVLSHFTVTVTLSDMW